MPLNKRLEIALRSIIIDLNLFLIILFLIIIKNKKLKTSLYFEFPKAQDRVIATGENHNYNRGEPNWNCRPKKRFKKITFYFLSFQEWFLNKFNATTQINHSKKLIKQLIEKIKKFY